MLLVLIVGLLSGFCSCLPAPPPSPLQEECVCGVESVATRIINGRRAVVGQFPWVVYIRQAGGWDSCTGTLITDRYVLTAAHCVPDHGDPWDMAVHVGQECGITRTWSRVEPIKVSKVIRHPEYMGVSGTGYDIALLQLEKPKFGTSRSNIMPVCLTNKTSSFDNYIISGWGLVNDGLVRVSNGCLNEADVNVLDPSECKRYGNAFKRTDLIMCAGGESNICKGDSGGPLMSRSEGRVIQSGIASFGRADCSIATKTPSGFERVDQHIDWIRNHVTEGGQICVK